MAIKKYYNHPFRVFSWVVAALLMLLVIMGGWRYLQKPHAKKQARITAANLKQATRQFEINQQQLQQQTQRLANNLKNILNQRPSRNALYRRMQSFSSIWGTALYQAGRPVVWNNFSLDIFKNIPPPPDSTKSYLNVRKIDNVLLWIAHTQFKISTQKGMAPYDLYTARRIRQTNALPIAPDREFSMLDRIPNATSFIHLCIFEKLPANITNYRTLHAINGDSVGVIYSKNRSLNKLQANWHRSNHFWWMVYGLICFIAIGHVCYFYLEEFDVWKGLILQVLIIGTGWILFHRIDIAETWLPSLLHGMNPPRIRSFQFMCNFIADGLFFLFIAFTLKRKLSVMQSKMAVVSFIKAIFMAVAVGLLNMVAIIYSINACYRLVYRTDMPLLSLQLFPGISVIIFYLTLGIVLLALTISLLAINHFMLFTCENQKKLVAAVCPLSFFVSLFIAELFISQLFTVSWVVVIGGVYFGLIIILSFWYYRVSFSLPYNSPLRNAATYSLLISLVASTVIYQAKKTHLDESLLNNVQQKAPLNSKKARNLTKHILTTLHKNFKSLTHKDLANNISIIQSRFTQVIEQTLPPEKSLYSYDMQLIDAHGKVLAGYSTNLSSPSWAESIDLRQLKTALRMEGISKKRLQPIIQEPSVIDAERYLSFFRGWIPIYGPESNGPIAWILCSVYRSRPDFDKPLRAVMASLHYTDLNDSFVIQHYKDGRLIKTSYRGMQLHYPMYNILQMGEKKALQQRRTIYYTSQSNQHSFRNLLIKRSPDFIIKCTTVLPSYQSVLFSFFRLHFTLLVIGFIILYIFQIYQTGSMALFTIDERFQYRILDSFFMATLFFLILLVIVTHFAIKQQNKELVKEQLFQKLEPITQAKSRFSSTPYLRQGESPPSLDSLTNTLNTDASLYDGPMLSASTTPQIYQQHLLPASLPFPVYRDLFITQKRDALTNINLNGQQLLIGYRSVLSDSSKPTAAVAIPTFVQSPKFNSQLLQTTSYLILLYILVFSIFILATIFISRQLTRPLFYIQQGLNKISRGDLNTIIPVTSNDEIGSLATAYNTMVRRLRELQQELAAREREAAWQEMAQQVAHEIKNPLTPMKLNIQHLERQLATGDYTVAELREKVERITQNLIAQIQSLNNIASDFSTFSKPVRKNDFTKVSMNDLINSVVQLYDHDENIIIEIKQTAIRSTVLGVKDDLRRVIINLIKNAHEAIGACGTIQLHTFVRKNCLFIEIEDDGTGINEENKPKIFVPNFSTKSGGTGLGLAISKKLVEDHSGSISFASIEGEGTTFMIKLPLKD